MAESEGSDGSDNHRPGGTDADAQLVGPRPAASGRAEGTRHRGRSSATGRAQSSGEAQQPAQLLRRSSRLIRTGGGGVEHRRHQHESADEHRVALRFRHGAGRQHVEGARVARGNAVGAGRQVAAGVALDDQRVVAGDELARQAGADPAGAIAVAVRRTDGQRLAVQRGFAEADLLRLDPSTR